VGEKHRHEPISIQTLLGRPPNKWKNIPASRLYPQNKQKNSNLSFQIIVTGNILVQGTQQNHGDHTRQEECDYNRVD
jgi:hypothetical protein